MKSPLTTILLAVLALSALLSLGLCWGYVSNARELRTLQTQAAFINNKRAEINALANLAVQYSQKNPAINPLLESAGLKGGLKTAPGTTPKPAAK